MSAEEERAAEERKWRFVPVVEDYVWPPVVSVDDWNRATIDEAGRPWIDGVRVNVKMYCQFKEEWSTFYDEHGPAPVVVKL